MGALEGPVALEAALGAGWTEPGPGRGRYESVILDHHLVALAAVDGVGWAHQPVGDGAASLGFGQRGMPLVAAVDVLRAHEPAIDLLGGPPPDAALTVLVIAGDQVLVAEGLAGQVAAARAIFGERLLAVGAGGVGTHEDSLALALADRRGGGVWLR